MVLSSHWTYGLACLMDDVLKGRMASESTDSQAMIMPVRIELRVGQAGPSCAFTIYMPFLFRPNQNDVIVIPTEMGQYSCRIRSLCHFLPAREGEVIYIILTDPILLDDYDDMLRLLDWFKANLEIDDFSSDQPEPESYYSLYRSVIRLLGRSREARPLIAYEPMEIKIFAETCRAVVLAELYEDGYEQVISSYNQTIEDLHNIVLSRKQDEPDGADMLSVIKSWEAMLNPDRRLKWCTTFDRCARAARAIFSRLRSIPSDHIPKPIMDLMGDMV